MKLLLNAVIRSSFTSRQLLLVMVLESVLQRNMVVLSVFGVFFLKIKQSPSPLLWLSFVLTGFCQQLT